MRLIASASSALALLAATSAAQGTIWIVDQGPAQLPDVDFNDIAPYAGLGFQSGFFGNRVEFAFDVGVLFQGDPDVDLDADGTLSNDPTLRARLKEEE